MADCYVEVHSALILALAKATRTTFILIDALNESQDAENLLQALFDAKGVAGGKVTMLCTSRQTRLPLSFDEYISSDPNTTKQLIQKYVDHRVPQMKTLSDGVLGLTVVRQVSRAADGLWPYARLMLDGIEKLPSAELIQRHLRSITLGLT